MKLKEQLIESIYRTIKGPYQFLFKQATAWDVDLDGLLHYPHGSLGYELGHFLQKHGFNIQPSLEEHDIFHVLTCTGTSVKDEIDMQFYLLGNGKRSPFLFIVIMTGFAFYPLSLKQFYNIFRKGRHAHQFFHLNFYPLLPTPLVQLQYTFNIT